MKSVIFLMFYILSGFDLLTGKLFPPDDSFIIIIEKIQTKKYNKKTTPVITEAFILLNLRWGIL